MDELKTQLKTTFAVVFSFYVKVHGFHWNVVGEEFYSYHKMFQKIYEDVYDSIDPLAEHIRVLGTFVPASLQRIQTLSKIADQSEVPDAKKMLEQLQSDNQIVIASLSDAFSEASKLNKQGLMNFLADRIDQHEKWGWFIKSSLK